MIILISRDLITNSFQGIDDVKSALMLNGVEEYRPFGTLSNIDTFDYTAKLRYGRSLGLVSRQKRAKTV